MSERPVTPDTIPISDAARRGADSVNVHIWAHGHEARGKWVAVRLSDGGSDGQLYDSRADAIRFQLHEHQCIYVCLPPFGQTMKPYEVEAMMTYFRSLYDAGHRWGDADAPAPIPQLTRVAAPRRGARLALPYRGEWK